MPLPPSVTSPASSQSAFGQHFSARVSVISKAAESFSAPAGAVQYYFCFLYDFLFQRSYWISSEIIVGTAMRCPRFIGDLLCGKMLIGDTFFSIFAIF